MQAIAIFALILVFAGACMGEGTEDVEQKCPYSQEDFQLFIDCLNTTKNGKCDFGAFMNAPKEYLTKEEQRTTAKCITSGKGYITSEGTLDDDLIKTHIQNIDATDEIKDNLTKAYDECAEEHKNSDDSVADTIICSMEASAEICGY